MIFPIVLTVVTVLFLNRTKVGTAMRALADNRDNTALLGVPVRRVEATAWFGSGVIFGFSGLLLATLVSMEIVALTFSIPIAALAAALIGRMDSLVVTLVAAFVIGIVQSGLQRDGKPERVPEHDPVRVRHHRAAVVRLARRGAREDGVAMADLRSDAATPPAATQRRSAASSAESDVDTRLPSMWSAITVARVVTLLVLLAGALFLIPALLSVFWLQIALTTVVYSAVTLGLGILVGRAGMVSLAQIPVVAAGVWIALRLQQQWSLPFPILLVLTGLLTGCVGTFIGFPALRLRGLYLALITLMGAGAITILLSEYKFPNGGSGFWGFDKNTPSGTTVLERPSIAEGDTAYYRYCVVVVAILFSSSHGTSAASPDGRGPRFARARSRRSRRVSTRPGSSCGASSSRRS